MSEAASGCPFWMHLWARWEVTERTPLIERAISDPKGESRVVGRIVYQERECIDCGKRQIRKTVAR